MPGIRALAALQALLATTVALHATPARAGDDWIVKGMADELQRGMSSLLRLEGYEPAYFLSCTVRDTDRWYVSAKDGALFASTHLPHRFASVDVRVGSYDMDSSEDSEGFFNPNQKFIPNNLVPLEPSQGALRRVLWLLTDFKYKAALMSWLKVKGKRVNDPKARTVASMSKVEPVRLAEAISPLRFDAKAWESAARRASAIFLDYPPIFDSSVESSASRITRYLVTSEGTNVTTTDFYYQVYVTAVTRAEDGQLLQDALAYYGRTLEDIPAPAVMEKEARELAERLVKLRSAPVLEPQTVPVLMSPEATGVFFHETLGHRLEGQRQDDDEEGRTFKGHLDQRILPDFVQVYDDPTARRAAGVSLNGFYRVDDEGVAGQRAVLVKDGVLKGFLMSRKPVEGAADSNGHGRSDGFQHPVGRMANLFVDGTQPVSHARLKEMLLEEVRRQGKPYGLIIETIAGGSTNTSDYGFQAFKGLPRIAWRVDAATGREDRVRGFEIVGTPLSSINKILATSDKYGVFNGYCGAESGSVPVSTVAPEMLFAEMELQRAEEGKERPPILTPPPFARP